MNYLAHARHHLHRPYALVGTALPDLLGVADRKSKLRAAHVPPPGGLDPTAEEVAEGLRAHFHDDVWFHQSAAFHDVTGTITRRLREAFPGTRLRASVLAHIGMELLLDAELCRRDPGLVRRYLVAFAGVDPGLVTTIVNRWAPRPALRLPFVLRFFRGARFFESYLHDGGFAFRLDQVSRRVGMDPLPEGFVSLVPELRALVRDRADDLLAPPAR